MWEDLQLGRRTEIDWINGEVVRLALRNGLHAPVNAALIALIRQAEEGSGQRWLPADLLAHVKQRRLKLPG
jgi:2-dehydropantoate 2-reductase